MFWLLAEGVEIAVGQRGVAQCRHGFIKGGIAELLLDDLAADIVLDSLRDGILVALQPAQLLGETGAGLSASGRPHRRAVQSRSSIDRASSPLGRSCAGVRSRRRVMLDAQGGWVRHRRVDLDARLPFYTFCKSLLLPKLRNVASRQRKPLCLLTDCTSLRISKIGLSCGDDPLAAKATASFVFGRPSKQNIRGETK
jgi:hypothetical protein